MTSFVKVQLLNHWNKVRRNPVWISSTFQHFSEYKIPFRKSYFGSELFKLSGNAVVAYKCTPELAVAAAQLLPDEKGKPE